MGISFKQRCLRYLDWWIRKSSQSSRFMNGLIIVGLCFGLYIIALFYEIPSSRYDKTPYLTYPITLVCDLSRIIDGDTIVVNCPKSANNLEKSLRSIRVWGIDAPESRQENWGEFATKTLKNIIDKEQALTVQIINQDRYQRFLGKIYINDLDIGLEMVQRGVAIVYRRYNHQKDYINAEKKAKIAQIGIWKVSGAQQNPEQWRRFNP